jgi:phage terminase large subunit
MANINIDLTNIKKVISPHFYPLLNNTNRIVVLRGGSSSGKSRFLVQMFIIRLLSRDKYNILCLRKFGSTLRTSTFAEFTKVISDWNLNQLFKINKSILSIECINGNKVIFMGVDNPEKLKSISGITNVFMEECTEFNQQDFEQITLRLRGRNKYKYQFYLAFNPVSSQSWVKKYFYDRTNADTYLDISTYKDNPFLDKDTIRNFDNLKETNLMWYQIYCLAEWGTTGEQVYNNYEVKDIKYKDEDFNLIYYGLDFGYHDPCTLVKIGFKDDVIYILDEIYQSKITNNQFIDLCTEKVDTNSYYSMIGDSAEPDRIEEFKRSRFKRIKSAKKGPGSIKYGIDWIKTKKIIIDPNCKNFIKEIQTYCYIKNKDGAVTDTPASGYDHILDAMRYSLEPLITKKEGLKILTWE